MEGSTLEELRARRALLSGGANKKARQKLNQKIKALAAAAAAAEAGPEPEPEPEAEPEPEPSPAGQPAAPWLLPGNYVAESAQGCHVARFEADWVVGVEPFDESDFGLPPGAELPDISVDPDERLLSVINPSETHARSFTISVPHTLRDSAGKALAAAVTPAADGAAPPCTTLLLLLRPRTVMDVCYVELEQWPPSIESDIKDVRFPPAAPDLAGAPPLYAFPLPRSGGPYLCSQGAGGYFTHSL